MKYKVCPNCRSELDFVSVLKSTNPMKIVCKGCDGKIIVDKLPAIGGVLITFVLAIFVWRVLESSDVNLKVSLLVLVALGLVAELAYFFGLKLGVIKSTLVSSVSEGSAVNPDAQRVLIKIPDDWTVTPVEGGYEAVSQDGTQKLIVKLFQGPEATDFQQWVLAQERILRETKYNYDLTGQTVQSVERNVSHSSAHIMIDGFDETIGFRLATYHRVEGTTMSTCAYHQYGCASYSDAVKSADVDMYP